jgi:hypothetical protein
VAPTIDIDDQTLLIARHVNNEFDLVTISIIKTFLSRAYSSLADEVDE